MADLRVIPGPGPARRPPAPAPRPETAGRSARAARAREPERAAPGTPSSSSSSQPRKASHCLPPASSAGRNAVNLLTSWAVRKHPPPACVVSQNTTIVHPVRASIGQQRRPGAVCPIRQVNSLFGLSLSFVRSDGCARPARHHPSMAATSRPPRVGSGWLEPAGPQNFYRFRFGGD